MVDREHVLMMKERLIISPMFVMILVRSILIQMLLVSPLIMLVGTILSVMTTQHSILFPRSREKKAIKGIEMFVPTVIQQKSHDSITKLKGANEQK